MGWPGSWDVKVTVVARLLVPEAVAQTAAGDWQPCPRFSEWAEFIIDARPLTRRRVSAVGPGGLNRHVVTLARSGNFHVKPGTTMVACTDGYRPVIFKLERVERSEAEE